MSEPEKPMTIADLVWIINYEVASGRCDPTTPVAMYDKPEGGSLSWLTSFESHPVLPEPGNPVRAQSMDREGAVMALVLHPGSPA